MGERWLQQLNRRRHDLFNYLQMLSGYLQLGDLEAVRRQLSNLQRTLEEESHLCRLGQPDLVLALLELKQWAQAQEHELEIVCAGQPQPRAALTLVAFLEGLCQQGRLPAGENSLLFLQAAGPGLRLSWQPAPVGMETGLAGAYYIAEDGALIWEYPGRDKSVSG
ncbi:MAG: Spo0B domain-containing protein [Bacillota bacterium]